ncbi:MAG: LCP family protein [Patescibacteria group bacterium]|jgi:LCP family protein required for cell wall assembly
MVIRKKDLRAKRVSRSLAAEREEVADMEVDTNVHVLRKPSSAKRFWGISLLVIVLLLAGWFGTKLAWSGWNVSKDTLFKDLFSFGTTTLIGEDKGRVNILLMGIPGEGNDGPNLTDTLMVASLATNTEGQSFLFSLPRDLYVKVPNYGNTKINAVYEIGNGQTAGSGGKLTSQVTGEILGLDIPYYCKLDFSGFEKFIDELGGITVTVDKNLYDDKYPAANKGYQVVDIKAGTYTMDGATALKYARSRQTTSDFDRARRQQIVMMAVKTKASELNLLTNPAKALALIDILSNHFESNMKLAEMKRLINLMKDFDVTKLVTKVFDDSPTGLLYGTKVDEIYVLRPTGDDFTIISDYVAKIISGTAKIEDLEQQVSKEPLKIEVLNGTTITGLAKKVATKLETAGYKIVSTGNNTVKGFTKNVVYDLSNGERVWEVRKLAESLQAEISTEKVTSTTGALARVVLGSDAVNQ